MFVLEKYVENLLHGECYFGERNCPESRSAEEFFGIEPEKHGWRLTEEDIEFMDVHNLLPPSYVDHVPGSDCDGHSCCWRTYIKKVGLYLFALVFSDENIKVMNDVIGIEFNANLYVLREVPD